MRTIQQYIDIINNTIANIDYPEYLPNLYEPIKYALSSGGKRLRPMLLLAVNDAFGGELEHAVWPAAGIEIFHNFTLVHDDVMDNADLRRGRPTVYKKWGVNTAILAGDTMTTMAFKCMAGCQPSFVPEVIDRFSMMTMNVYEGQQIDAEFETRSDVTFDEYIKMIVGKTAALIAYPAAIGALIAGASQQDVEMIFNFGVSLGIAFQIMDDYLDVYGDTATFGKEIGGDILNDKKTWLYIFAQDHDKGGEFSGIIAEKLTPDKKIGKVTAFYNSLSLREEGKKLINKYTDDALEYLNDTSMDDEAKKWLKDFALKLMKRDK